MVDRAIWNCPNSIELIKEKLKLELAMANAEMPILMPEDFMTKLIVKETLENGFIIHGGSNNPSTPIELFRSLLDILRQRILFVLVTPTSWRPSCVRLITSTKGTKQLDQGTHCAGDRVQASPTPPSTAEFLCSPSLEGTAARQSMKQRLSSR